MGYILPFTRKLIHNNPHQIVCPNVGIRYEESRLLGEAAEKRRIKLSCLLCDTGLSFADPECSTCGATTQMLLYSNPDGSYTVMPYLVDAEMTVPLFKKAVGLGHVYCCLSCNQPLGREGECSFCQSKTYYVKPHNDPDACSLLPELCLIENYIRQENEVDLRVLGVVNLQVEKDAPVKDVRERQPLDSCAAGVNTPAEKKPPLTDTSDLSTPKETQERTDKEMIREFLSAWVVKSEGGITPRDIVYKKYQQWIGEQDREPVSKKLLFRQLLEVYPLVRVGQNRINGNLRRCFRGIKLHSDI